MFEGNFLRRFLKCSNQCKKIWSIDLFELDYALCLISKVLEFNNNQKWEYGYQIISWKIFKIDHLKIWCDWSRRVFKINIK